MLLHGTPLPSIPLPAFLILCSSDVRGVPAQPGHQDRVSGRGPGPHGTAPLLRGWLIPSRQGMPPDSAGDRARDSNIGAGYPAAERVKCKCEDGHHIRPAEEDTQVGTRGETSAHRDISVWGRSSAHRRRPSSTGYAGRRTSSGRVSRTG